MDDKIFAVHSEISSGLKWKQISKNLHFTWTKNQAVSGLSMNRNQTQQYIYCTSRRAIAIFPLEQLNVVWTFRKTPTVGCSRALCLLQIFHCSIPSTQQLCSPSHVKAQIHQHTKTSSGSPVLLGWIHRVLSDRSHQKKFTDIWNL